MKMLEGYWDIEGIRQVEDEELRVQVVEQEEVKYVLRLYSKGKDAAEISHLMDLPLDKVESILKVN